MALDMASSNITCDLYSKWKQPAPLYKHIFPCYSSATLGSKKPQLRNRKADGEKSRSLFATAANIDGHGQKASKAPAKPLANSVDIYFKWKRMSPIYEKALPCYSISTIGSKKPPLRNRKRHINGSSSDHAMRPWALPGGWGAPCLEMLVIGARDATSYSVVHEV